MLPFLWIELCTFAAYGLAWLADAWRLLGLVTYALQVGLAALAGGRGCWRMRRGPAQRACSPATCLPACLHVVQYSRASTSACLADLQAVVVAFHLGRLPGAEQVIPVVAALQCVLLLFRLQVRHVVLCTDPSCAALLPLGGAAALAQDMSCMRHCINIASQYALLQFFSRVFPATRFAFLEDISQVMHDVSGPVACPSTYPSCTTSRMRTHV